MNKKYYVELDSKPFLRTPKQVGIYQATLPEPLAAFINEPIQIAENEQIARFIENNFAKICQSFQSYKERTGDKTKITNISFVFLQSDSEDWLAVSTLHNVNIKKKTYKYYTVSDFSQLQTRYEFCSVEEESELDPKYYSVCEYYDADLFDELDRDNEDDENESENNKSNNTHSDYVTTIS